MSSHQSHQISYLVVSDRVGVAQFGNREAKTLLSVRWANNDAWVRLCDLVWQENTCGRYFEPLCIE